MAHVCFMRIPYDFTFYLYVILLQRLGGRRKNVKKGFQFTLMVVGMYSKK